MLLPIVPIRSLATLSEQYLFVPRCAGLQRTAAEETCKPKCSDRFPALEVYSCSPHIHAKGQVVVWTVHSTVPDIQGPLLGLT